MDFGTNCPHAEFNLLGLECCGVSLQTVEGWEMKEVSCLRSNVLSWKELTSPLLPFHMVTWCRSCREPACL